MKNLTSNKVRSLFLLGGVSAMMGATMMVSQPARADKAQNYKVGATALGILGAVLAVKGKTLPAIAAGAGAYYAYEKGKDAENDNRYNDYRWNNNRYNRNDNSRNYYGDRYDNNNRYDSNIPYGNRYDNRNDRKNRYDNRDNHYNGHSYNR